MGAGLTVQVLGPVEVLAPTGPIAVSGSKLQVLLATLALAVPHPVSDDRLIDEIWGDDQPANPANSLQAQVSQLRRLLGSRHRRQAGRRATPSRSAPTRSTPTCSRTSHERPREASEADDHRGAAQLLRRALGLVRGPVLGDLLDHERLRAAAAALEEEVLAVQEALGDAELASGRHAEIVGPLTELVAAHPLRERFAAQLITALYRCGRQVDALQAYAGVREALVEEFGIDPGAELRELEAQVLAHDPALAGAGDRVGGRPRRGPPRAQGIGLPPDAGSTAVGRARAPAGGAPHRPGRRAPGSRVASP